MFFPMLPLIPLLVFIPFYVFFLCFPLEKKKLPKMMRTNTNERNDEEYENALSVHNIFAVNVPTCSRLLAFSNKKCFFFKNRWTGSNGFFFCFFQLCYSEAIFYILFFFFLRNIKCYQSLSFSMEIFSIKFSKDCKYV